MHAEGYGKKLTARNALGYTLGIYSPELLGGNSVDICRIRDWQLYMRCILHIVSSAIGWGLRPFSRRDVLDNCHIGIASLRNASQSLLDASDVVLPSRVVFEEDELSELDRRIIWTMLGVDDQYLPTILWVNPRWHPARNVLQVSPDLEDRVDWFDIIRAVIIYFMRWKKFQRDSMGRCRRHWSKMVVVGTCWHRVVGQLCFGVRFNGFSQQAFFRRVCTLGRSGSKVSRDFDDNGVSL